MAATAEVRAEGAEASQECRKGNGAGERAAAARVAAVMVVVARVVVVMVTTVAISVLATTTNLDRTTWTKLGGSWAPARSHTPPLLVLILA